MPTEALVLAGGDVSSSERIQRTARACDIVIVADGGLRHAAALGVQPTVIVGDFDSVTQHQLDLYPSVPRQKHPRDKGKLDLELALEEAQRRGADSMTVLGVFGSRLDQTVAGLLVCARLHREGVPCRLHGRTADAYPLSSGESVRPTAPRGTTFSVVSLDDRVTVSVRGARYPADRTRLPFGVGLGVSNVTDADPEITCHDGLLVVIVERNPDE